MTSFAEQIAAFAAKAQGAADRTVRETVQEIGARLVERSPVRTGRFRSNWVYGLDVPSADVTDATDGTTVRGIDALPEAAAGHVHWIGNNLPYGQAIEYGASDQAPQGVVGVTTLEFQAIVEAAAKKANP